MAMTKKEQAEFKAAINRADTLAALRHEVERNAASDLLVIDRQIIAASASENFQPNI